MTSSERSVGRRATRFTTPPIAPAPYKADATPLITSTWPKSTGGLCSKPTLNGGASVQADDDRVWRSGTHLDGHGGRRKLVFRDHDVDVTGLDVESRDTLRVRSVHRPVHEHRRTANRTLVAKHLDAQRDRLRRRDRCVQHQENTDERGSHVTAQRRTYTMATPPGTASGTIGKSRPWRVTVRPAMMPTADPNTASLNQCRFAGRREIATYEEKM